MSWACLIFLLFSSLARAENSWTGEVGFSAGDHQTTDSILNPGNRVFETPGFDSLLDVRSEFKMQNETNKIVIRPRFTAMSETFDYTDTLQMRQRALGRWDLTDAYLEWAPSDDLLLTGGLIVDGWGPAEFVNPSNPFFHVKSQSKSFFFKEKGHVLAKALWNPTPKTAVSVVSEPLSNRETTFREGEDFRPEWILRGEWQSEDASQLIGLLAGQEFAGAGFVGEYFQYRHDPSGFSVYWEARHSQKPQRFDPVSQAGFTELVLQEQDGMKTYSVAGLRWEGRADARLEWIHYGLGYSESEWDQVVQSVTQLSPFLLNNAQRFARPGLEFLTKNWWSVSVRVPDLGPWNDWQWTNRLLLGVGDDAFDGLRSGLFQSDLEMPAFEAWTFFAEVQNHFGKENTELLLTSEQDYYLGARWAW